MKKDPTILITGGSGMVGSQALFGIKPTKKELDITKPTTIEKAILKYKPDVIVHMAALVDMRICELEPTKAQLINTTGTKNISLACKKHCIKLVYLSSGAVFDGKKETAYCESDIPHPLNVYGKTKYAGEKIVQKLLPNALIIRTGWLFGSGKNDTKFVSQVIQKLHKGETLSAVSDRYGSPTYVPDLLQTIEKLITAKKSGIYHVVNSDSASYYDIAKEVKKLMKSNTEVTPINSKSFGKKIVKRAHNETLSSSKIKLHSWKVALKEYI